MDLVDEIEAVEYPGIRNLRWYYHGFVFSEMDFSDMLLSGLKCCKLLSLEPKGFNGKYYISLSMDMLEKDQVKSSYKLFERLPRFIISNIKPIKCSRNMLYDNYSDTILPFRYSGYNDEYQAFWRIKQSNFIGLECSLMKWYKEGNRESLENLKRMIIIMKKLNIKLPIYDYSRCDYDNVHVIEQEKYLILSKSILDNLGQK